MARHKNPAFVGVRISDVDADAPSFHRAIANVVGDMALIFDQVTGENGEANVYDRSAPGRGAPLGVPIVNQWIGQSIHLTTPETDDSKHAGVGDTMLLPYLIFPEPGETELVVRIAWETDLSVVTEANPHFVVKDTNLDFVFDSPMTAVVDGRTVNLEARITGLESQLYIAYLAIDSSTVVRTSGDTPLGRLVSCSIFPPGRRGGSAMPAIEEDNDFGVTEPAATDGVAVNDVDELIFDTTSGEPPIDSFQMQVANRGLNGLLEYITGWPAGGNADYTLEDQDGGGAPDSSNPARSRFMAHTRSLHASEPEIPFSLLSVSLGAMLLSGRFVVADSGDTGVDDADIGMLDWAAPWPTSMSSQIIARVPTVFPDFQTGSSNLKCYVLIGSNGYDLADWEVRAVTGTAGGGSDFASDATLESLNPGTDTLWLAEIDAVPFVADLQSALHIACSKSSAREAGEDEICFLAYLFRWEP